MKKKALGYRTPEWMMPYIAGIESIERVATTFAIASQVVQWADKFIKPWEKLMLAHLRKRKGRPLRIPGQIIWLVKKNTIRRRPDPPTRWNEVPTVEELYIFEKVYPKWLKYQCEGDSRRETANEQAEVLLAYMKRINRRVVVLDGIEIRRVKKNTLRWRIVGPCSRSKYLMPIPDER